MGFWSFSFAQFSKSCEETIDSRTNRCSCKLYLDLSGMSHTSEPIQYFQIYCCVQTTSHIRISTNTPFLGTDWLWPWCKYRYRDISYLIKRQMINCLLLKMECSWQVLSQELDESVALLT